MIVRKAKLVFDFIIVFLYIYGITINVLPFSLSKIILLALLARCLLTPKFIVKLINDKFIKYCTLIWIIIVAQYTINALFITETRDFGFIQQMLWYYIEGIVGTFLLFRYLLSRHSVETVMKLVFWVFCVQSFFIVLTFVNIGFRNFTNTVLTITDERNLSSYRMKGFANSGGAGLSYLQSLGVFIGCSLFLSNKQKQKILIAIGLIVIILSQLFVARTGLYFSLLFTVAMLIQHAINRGSAIVLLKQTFKVIAGIAVAFLVFKSVLPERQLEFFNDRVLGRALEMYTIYIETGKLETASTTALARMQFYPDNAYELIFGAAVWDGGATRTRVVDSDIGYVRMVFALGVVFTALFYSIYFFYIFNLYQGHLAKTFLVGVIALLLVFVLGEMKEPFLGRMSGIVKVLVMIYMAYSARHIRVILPPQ